jgi:hypothetical protein
VEERRGTGGELGFEGYEGDDGVADSARMMSLQAESGDERNSRPVPWG